MLSANSCRGVLNISGIKCSSNFSYLAREHNVKQNPGRTRPARPLPRTHKQNMNNKNKIKKNIQSTYVVPDLFY